MKKNIGNSLDDLLKEDGTYEEAKEEAVKRVIVYQVIEAMKERQISKAEMARELKTSRAALDRLLNPDSDAVTLHSLKKAAAFLGKKLVVELV